MTFPETKRASYKKAPDPPKRDKRWRRMIRRVVPKAFRRVTRSSHSEETRPRYDCPFKTSVDPSLGELPDEHTPPTPSASYVCDSNTPVEIACVSKPTGEMSVQIEARSSVDSFPIPPQQISLITLENPVIVGQCQGSDLSWTYDRTQSLHCPPRLAPDEPEGHFACT